MSSTILSQKAISFFILIVQSRWSIAYCLIFKGWVGSEVTWNANEIIGSRLKAPLLFGTLSIYGKSGLKSWSEVLQKKGSPLTQDVEF